MLTVLTLFICGETSFTMGRQRYMVNLLVMSEFRSDPHRCGSTSLPNGLEQAVGLARIRAAGPPQLNSPAVRGEACCRPRALAPAVRKPHVDAIVEVFGAFGTARSVAGTVGGGQCPRDGGGGGAGVDGHPAGPVLPTRRSTPAPRR